MNKDSRGEDGGETGGDDTECILNAYATYEDSKLFFPCLS